jgi:hypothetical protein
MAPLARDRPVRAAQGEREGLVGRQIDGRREKGSKPMAPETPLGDGAGTP